MRRERNHRVLFAISRVGQAGADVLLSQIRVVNQLNQPSSTVDHSFAFRQPDAVRE